MVSPPPLPNAMWEQLPGLMNVYSEEFFRNEQLSSNVQLLNWNIELLLLLKALALLQSSFKVPGGENGYSTVTPPPPPL